MRNFWVVVKKTKNGWTPCDTRHRSSEFYRFKADAKRAIYNGEFSVCEVDLAIARVEATKIHTNIKY